MTRPSIGGRRFAAAAVLSASAALSCGGGPQGAPAEPAGTATFRWTLEETSDATLCQQHGAANVTIDVYGQKGAYVEHMTTPCTAFVATAPLAEGGYSVALQLVDDRGTAVSTTLATSFYVANANDAVVASDFAKMCFP